jgi:excisionase family DNA binding protein
VSALAVLTLRQAGKFLQLHPYTVAQKTKAGEIPGRKIGGCWRFLRSELEARLRSPYNSPRRPVPVADSASQEEVTWHFTREVGFTGSMSPYGDAVAYAKALGLRTRS